MLNSEQNLAQAAECARLAEGIDRAVIVHFSDGRDDRGSPAKPAISEANSAGCSYMEA